MLDRLFDADRASLLTETVLGVDPRLRHRRHPVAQRLHHRHRDRRVPGRGRRTGAAAKRPRRSATATTRTSAPTSSSCCSSSPLTADGAVPIAYRIGDGNTPDDLTHIPTWDELRAPGRAGRLPLRRRRQVVLCRRDGPHPPQRGPVRHRAAARPPRGHLVPGLGADPRTGLDRGGTAAPAPDSSDPEQVWRTFTAPAPSAEGYRVIWVHSSGQSRPRRRGPRGPHRGGTRRHRRGRRPAGQPEDPAQDHNRRRSSRHHRPAPRPAPPAGSAFRSPRPPKRPTTRNTGAAPARTPVTAARQKPCSPSPLPSTPSTSPTTPPPTAASRWSPTTPHHPGAGARRLPLPAQSRAASPHAQRTTTGRAGLPRERPPHRGAAAVPLPRHAHRSAHRTRDPHLDESGQASPASRSTPNCATAPPPAPHASWRSSATSQRHQLVHHDEVVQTFQPELTPLQRQGPRPPPHPRQHVYTTPHHLTGQPTWGAKSVTRSAERQINYADMKDSGRIPLDRRTVPPEGHVAPGLRSRWSPAWVCVRFDGDDVDSADDRVTGQRSRVLMGHAHARRP